MWKVSDAVQQNDQSRSVESITLPTGDVAVVGSTVSICVRRTGKVGGKQMRWYAGRILEINEGRALVELSCHPGERANLGPRNIRLRNAGAAQHESITSTQKSE